MVNRQIAASPLDRFESELAERIGRPAYARPFVCHGSPLECRAMVVGSHLATALDLDFWEFWEPGAGFRRAAWEAEYRKARRERGAVEVSPTRRILDRITEAAGPARCVEANVHPAGPDVLGFLLESIRPATVLAHGAKAREFFAEYCGVGREPTDGFQRVSTGWGSPRLRMVSHLQGCSYARAHELGAAMRDE